MGEEYDSTAPPSVWFGLIVCATLSFYCQAAVTEERFVPALNVIANHFGIPDDVAGATLMAAGASSPELFSSLVALFITHSALGLGTIVGSEIFNQLVICAGAVAAARGGTLTLDRAIVTREVGFYALSILLLFNALKDRRIDENDPDGTARIYISLLDASLLFGGYVLYVIVCGNFNAIMGFIRPKKGLTDEEEGGRKTYGSMGDDYLWKSKTAVIKVPEEMPFLQQTREPKENFCAPPASQRDLMAEAADGGQEKPTIGLYHALGSDREGSNNIKSVDPRSSRDVTSEQSSQNFNSVRASVRSLLGRFSDGLSVRLFTFLAESDKPSDQHDLYDLECNAFEERVACFLWQRSIFYNKAKVALHGWHLRWFNFTHDKVVSVPDRRDFDEHQLDYPRFRQMEVDESRLILRFRNPVPGRRDYYLMAPSSHIFEEVVKKCEHLMKVWEQKSSSRGAGTEGMDSPEPVEIEKYDSEEGDGDADPHPSIIEFPSGEGALKIALYIILFPLNALMHLTIPDVRHLSPKGDPKGSLLMAFVAITSCLIWLIVGSYAMVASLEHLAFLMDIPDAVIGVTVSAAGTSLPNYVASQCAARQGFGNMAVSNAFGSNSFNILVGLGLPWTLYTIFVTRGEPYDGLRDDGITISVIILATVLLAFVVLILISDFVLLRWHAPAFLGLYALYLAYAIGQVYIGGMNN